MSVAARVLQVETLLDEGYEEEEIAVLIGLDEQIVAALCREIRREAQNRVARVLARTADSYHESDELNLSSTVDSHGKNSRPAASTASLTMSRGGKIKRLAEAMARIRGLFWPEMPERQRRSYIRLAEFAMEALEAVESGDVDLRAGDRVRRELAKGNISV